MDSPPDMIASFPEGVSLEELQTAIGRDSALLDSTDIAVARFIAKKTITTEQFTHLSLSRRKYICKLYMASKYDPTILEPYKEQVIHDEREFMKTMGELYPSDLSNVAISEQIFGFSVAQLLPHQCLSSPIPGVDQVSCDQLCWRSEERDGFHVMPLVGQLSDLDGLEQIVKAPEIKSVIINGSLIRQILNPHFLRFKKLVSLDLSNNRIAFISDQAFAYLCSLQNLILKGNRLEKLSPIFMELKNLTLLDLSHNRLKVITPGALHGLEALRDLCLDDNQLAEVPEDFFEPILCIEKLAVAGNVSTFTPLILYVLLKDKERLSHMKCVGIGSEDPPLKPSVYTELQRCGIELRRRVPGSLSSVRSLRTQSSDTDSLVSLAADDTEA